MTNLDILAVREFRRFANTSIYQDEEIKYILLNEISSKFTTDNITFNSLPQQMIIFENRNKYTEDLNIIIACIFIELFNNPKTIRLIRNKIYNEVHDEDQKQLLNSALYKIQIGDPAHLGLLFNITIPKNTLVYLHL